MRGCFSQPATARAAWARARLLNRGKCKTIGPRLGVHHLDGVGDVVEFNQGICQCI